MSGVWVITQMTFLEARRNRVAWSLVFFCLVIVLTSFVFQEVTISSYDRIVRDVGLAAIHAFGVLLAVFLGVTVVTREIERRTVYMLLSKPLGRAQYLVGKLAGVWLTIAVCLGLMLVAFLVEMAAYRAPIKLVIFQCFWLMLLEYLLLASFSILISTFSSPIMAAFASISLFVIGHLSSDLYFFGRRSASLFVRNAAKAMYFALPDLEHLNLKTQVSVLQEVSWGTVASSSLYALVYVVAFFSLSVAIFARRDLK